MSGCGASALLIFWTSLSEEFDVMAWVAPLAVFAAVLLGTILLVRRWSAGGPQGTGNREQATVPATTEDFER
jgi:negative regulator of sigma E activity